MSFRPSIQFSEDEALACRCMTNEVQIYDSSNWNAGISQRVRAPNLGGALLSFDPPSHLAIFVKESKVKLKAYVVIRIVVK